MNTYMDCPHCGSEFVVSEDIVHSNLRCPECLKWFNAMDDLLDSRMAYAGYASFGDSEYDDYGYQQGYDY